MSITNHRMIDFISLFNTFWYRDFPLSEVYKPLSNRVGWTAHIGSVVKSSADLLGLFTYFESGTRTDAIIRDNEEHDVAHLEWEWWQPFTDKGNSLGIIQAAITIHREIAIFLKTFLLREYRGNYHAARNSFYP